MIPAYIYIYRERERERDRERSCPRPFSLGLGPAAGLSENRLESGHGQGFGSTSELRSCVKVEVAVLGSPSLKVLMVSVDVKRH